jgi:hypothetical protein
LVQVKWKLKFNKRNSVILSSEYVEEIIGIKHSFTVKYQGVRIAVYKKK